MKKILCLLIACSMFFSTCAQAASMPMFSQDFNGYSDGVRSISNLLLTSSSEEHIYVTNDPTGNENNKVLRFEGAADGESYFQTKNFDFSRKTEISFKVYKEKEGSMDIYFRDKNSTVNNLYIFSLKDRTAVFGRGNYQKSVAFETGTWAEFKIVVDVKNGVIKYYSDLENAGTLKFEYELDLTKAFGKNFENHYFEETLLRFSPGKSNALYYIDDLAILSDMSVVSDISLTSLNIFRIFDGKKTSVDRLREGEMMFSVKAKSDADNKSAMILAALYSKDGEMKKIAVSDKTELTKDYKEIMCGIKTDSLAEGDTVSVFIVDSMENISPLCRKNEIPQADVYFRPSAEEVMDDLYKQHPQKDDHPRTVLTANDFNELRNYAQTDSDYIEMFNKITTTVSGTDGKSGYLTYKQPTYTVEQEGTLLSTSRAVMNRVIPMAYMYQMTNDEKYAAGVWRQIEPVCDEESFPDWHPAHFLDTGEMALAVAIAYDWCYDYWTDTQKEYIEKALYRNIIKLISDTAEGKESYNAPSAGTNWGPVCGGGAIAAATAVAHIYPSECANVISYCTRSVENAIKDYAPDGGYSEGPTYWDYGTTYLVWLISSLESACGTDYGLLDAPGLSVTGYFPSYIVGPEGAFNYHDSSGEGTTISNALAYYFADRFEDKNLGGIRYNALKNGIYDMKQYLSVADMLFYNPDNINKEFSYASLPKDKYLRGIETVTMKGSMTDPNSAFLTLHGGYDSANHGNLDSGTFVLDMGGVRWFKELGGGNYSLPGYFGAKRWNYYVNRAEGQNTLVINPTEEADQYPASTSYMEKFKENGNDGALAVLDMSPAYEKSYATSVKRGAMLTNDRKTMIIQDEVSGIYDYDTQTEGFQSVLYWFGHTVASIEIANDGKSAVLTKSGKRLHAQLVSDDDTLSLSVCDAAKLDTSPEKHELETTYSYLKKLTVKVENKESVNFAIVFNLLEDNQETPEYEYSYVPLKEW